MRSSLRSALSAVPGISFCGVLASDALRLKIKAYVRSTLIEILLLIPGLANGQPRLLIPDLALSKHRRREDC